MLRVTPWKSVVALGVDELELPVLHASSSTPAPPVATSPPAVRPPFSRSRRLTGLRSRSAAALSVSELIAFLLKDLVRADGGAPQNSSALCLYKSLRQTRDDPAVEKQDEEKARQHRHDASRCDDVRRRRDVE